MTFSIVAAFPLGTYRAHGRDGQLDVLPSPARLHAALLAAAGQGARAEATSRGLQPRAADRAALRWLEEHPPDALAAPGVVIDTAVATAYRAEGFFGVRDRRMVLTTRSDGLGCVALAAPVAWIWDAAPPQDVVSALEALCRDVPYLGTVDSPVVLGVGPADPTHRLDAAASLFAGSGLDVEVPRPGRTDALERRFAATVGRRAPSNDRNSRSEAAVVEPVERSALATARYVPLVSPSPAAPWPTVILLSIDQPVPTDRRVAWSVALHRALVARIGDGAPSLVTGRYEPGARRPANHLAIQYVSRSLCGTAPIGEAGAFALLVPAGAELEDLAVLERAMRWLETIRFGPHRRVRVVGEASVVDGASFWPAVPAGHIRVWVTDTPAIPESRPPRGRGWTLADAALLSVGLVFRDMFERRRIRAEWYEALVAGVSRAGARVYEAHKLHSFDASRYVHRTSPESAIQPYRAALSLGRLVDDRTILAIGQSRHLGGGLLTPLDLPRGLLTEPEGQEGRS